MGRSVYVSPRAVAVCYRTLIDPEEWDHEPDADDFRWEFEDLIECVRDMAHVRWPSFNSVKRWEWREGIIILENWLAEVGISEYCGLVSIWLSPREGTDYPDLSARWCSQIAPEFERCFRQYRKLATFSNGEAIFEKVEHG